MKINIRDFEITTAPGHPAGAVAGAIATIDNEAHDPVLGTVVRFNDALNTRQLDAMMALLTEDTVFENTFPPPDGSRYVGKAAVRGFWEDFSRATPASRFEIEEITTLGERCVMRWVYHWAGLDESGGHIRGADIYRITNGLMAEKLSYVKG
ncbi:MAG: nuclear transport factor 2 family protein [Bellilinea sp.]